MPWRVPSFVCDLTHTFALFCRYVAGTAKAATVEKDRRLVYIYVCPYSPQHVNFYHHIMFIRRSNCTPIVINTSSSGPFPSVRVFMHVARARPRKRSPSWATRTPSSSILAFWRTSIGQKAVSPTAECCPMIAPLPEVQFGSCAHSIFFHVQGRSLPPNIRDVLSEFGNASSFESFDTSTMKKCESQRALAGRETQEDRVLERTAD